MSNLSSKQATKLIGTLVPYRFKNKYPLALALIGGFVAGVGFIDFDKRNWYSVEDGRAELNVCFTPPKGCSELVAKQIHQAKKSIFVQAYGFTSLKIINQLIEAHKRGVKVHIMLDKSNLTDTYSKMRLVQKEGIKVYIDHAPGIAHNKVMVIDGRRVITGSFNFTDSADKRNVENVILINNASLACKYLENWQNRLSNAKTSQVKSNISTLQ